MRFFSILVLSTILLVFTACGSTSTNNSNECNSDIECLGSKSGTTCLLGKCTSLSNPSCLTDSDCSSGNICSNGQCTGKEYACFLKECPAGQICKDGKCQDKPKDITPQEFCNTSSSNRCRHIYKCYSQERIKQIEQILGATNQESCSRELSKLCETITLDGIKANRQAYSMEKARECLSQFENHTCSANSDSPSICSEASVGRSGWKQACVYSDDCSGKNAKCLEKQCTGDITPSTLQQECSEATADQCKTLNCLTLKPNLQNKTGMCSIGCLSHSDCGEGSQCFKLSDETNVCFSTCRTNSDCLNGFVCVDVGNSTGDKICFVEVP